MSKAIAESMMGFAGNTLRGMTGNANAGKRFVMSGNKSANEALKRLKQAKPMRPKMRSNKVKSVTRNSNVRARQTAGYSVGNFVGGGINNTITNMNKKNMKFGEALKTAHSTNGKLDAKKIAGTYVGVSAAGRIATGGGVLKDKNGNTNVIGIPFI